MCQHRFDEHVFANKPSILFKAPKSLAPCSPPRQPAHHTACTTSMLDTAAARVCPHCSLLNLLNDRICSHGAGVQPVHTAGRVQLVSKLHVQYLQQPVPAKQFVASLSKCEPQIISHVQPRWCRAATTHRRPASARPIRHASTAAAQARVAAVRQRAD